MCGKMAISAYILKIAKNDLLLRLQMRVKEMLISKMFEKQLHCCVPNLLQQAVCALLWYFVSVQLLEER